VRSRIDAASEALAEAQEKIRVETDRAISEAQQLIESLTSQCKEVYAQCESRLRAFQEELTRSSAQEVEVFRERLRSVLTTLLSSLG
jgi:CHASE3 domain sensor protein